MTGDDEEEHQAETGRIEITPTVWINESDLDETFVRASGPGGQNVNKVSTAVQLRFDAGASEVLTAAMKQRLQRLAGRRMTEEGIVVITANRHRTQARNRADARQRLVELLREAAKTPARRIATRPSYGAKQRRIETKKRRGEVKAMRQSKPGAE